MDDILFRCAVARKVIGIKSEPNKTPRAIFGQSHLEWAGHWADHCHEVQFGGSRSYLTVTSGESGGHHLLKAEQDNIQRLVNTRT